MKLNHYTKLTTVFAGEGTLRHRDPERSLFSVTLFYVKNIIQNSVLKVQFRIVSFGIFRYTLLALSLVNW